MFYDLFNIPYGQSCPHTHSLSISTLKDFIYSPVTKYHINAAQICSEQKILNCMFFSLQKGNYYFRGFCNFKTVTVDSARKRFCV